MGPSSRETAEGQGSRTIRCVLMLCPVDVIKYSAKDPGLVYHCVFISSSSSLIRSVNIHKSP